MNPMVTIAVRAAREASKVLLRYYERADVLNISEKGRNEFVSEVDRNAEQVIIEVLREKYPNHAILAEESGKHAGDDYQWVIDPLDGTTNYLHGFPQFAISIAMKHKGRLELGVIYDPLRDEMFTTSRGSGALLNDRKLRVSNRKGLKGALLGTGLPYRDFRFRDQYMGMLNELIEDTAGVRRPGSAALDFAYVAAGRLDGFWELGLSEWDFAAGALLVREAGGMVTDIGGGERYLETGNVIAGGIKVHNAMLRKIRPHLDDKLNA
ncbi:Archaeal fructose-1,6-bisphosphatase or related enzyme of inositol monophosphatase family [endosymbiont of Ridgeia piscesae]|jgi:myo-inositol-1(or 4)-monophosphatase|uniref:Inositol-1-monophosphatase n=2 Tax=endosymbiont of Ridgeia piscesae TaxID=54398 RepID=A0A0T5YZN0_9GAMM|nr:inositol monophosphatase family protein [endosymbiont of Ridgeia piscesae]KRT55995.1 Archaeal fructose-1,6-bisphosphatase or related enzyme of inositol monophosphatase family [endosymbiont of Ridgeia piscesae]